MTSDELSPEARASMTRYIDEGRQDFVIGLDDSTVPGSAFHAVAAFVYKLDERVDSIMQARYGASVDEAMRDLLISIEADDAFAASVAADRQTGRISYEELGEQIKREAEAYQEHFTPIGDDAIAVKATLNTDGAFVVIAEDASLALDSDHRYCAVLLTQLDGPSFGPPMRFRSAVTMHDAVMNLSGAVASE